MSTVHVLSDDDVFTLREIAREHRLRLARERGRGRTLLDAITTPDVYLARTGPVGIPALDVGTFTGTGTGTDAEDDAPGSADCDVFRVLSGVPERIETSRPVYNFSTTAIPAGSWVVVIRDKFGTWIAVPPGGLNSQGSVGGGTAVVGVVHVVEETGTGTGGGWYCQTVYYDGGWKVENPPDEYHGVVELNGLQPRKEDALSGNKDPAYAVTILYRDGRGTYFIDYPRLSDSDTITFPNTYGCVGTTISPLTYQTVRVVWDNFTNFPNVDVRAEVAT